LGAIDIDYFGEVQDGIDYSLDINLVLGDIPEEDGILEA